jgi:REP element-mobilizing transposase RayT
MARKLRLEFPGAIYHVINRGNYRADIFRSEGAKAAFEGCLFESCAKSGWVLHAFVLMSNHYHLALETPEGNLVAGMQWLQATFANRFNRLRGERGHLFQGRYKALLVEDGAALGQVCHYIHLNPVRAGLVTVERLGEYRHSSYWFLWQPALRPVFLHPETALAEAGDLMDEQRGWQAYEKYLDWQVAEGPAGKSQAYVPLSRGWALGSEGFKRALVKDHALGADPMGSGLTLYLGNISDQRHRPAFARLRHGKRAPPADEVTAAVHAQGQSMSASMSGCCSATAVLERGGWTN